MKSTIINLVGSFLIVVSGAVVAKQPVLSVIGSEIEGNSGEGKAVLDRDSRPTGTLEVVFVEGDQAVVGLQFDMKVKNAEAIASSCGTLRAGHSLTCNDLDKKTVRVIVFSAQNAAIKTGTLLALPGVGKAEIIESTVQMGDANAQPIEAEVL